MEKLEWLDYQMVEKKIVDTVTHFNRIHERGRQTDGQTRRHRVSA